MQLVGDAISDYAVSSKVTAIGFATWGTVPSPGSSALALTLTLNLTLALALALALALTQVLLNTDSRHLRHGDVADLLGALR